MHQSSKLAGIRNLKGIKGNLIESSHQKLKCNRSLNLLINDALAGVTETTNSIATSVWFVERTLMSYQRQIENTLISTDPILNEEGKRVFLIDCS